MVNFNHINHADLKIFDQTVHIKVLVLLQNIETNFFLGVLKNILKILDDILDDVFVLVQHPVSLLEQRIWVMFIQNLKARLSSVRFHFMYLDNLDYVKTWLYKKEEVTVCYCPRCYKKYLALKNGHKWLKNNNLTLLNLDQKGATYSPRKGKIPTLILAFLNWNLARETHRRNVAHP